MGVFNTSAGCRYAKMGIKKQDSAPRSHRDKREFATCIYVLRVIKQHQGVECLKIMFLTNGWRPKSRMSKSRHVKFRLKFNILLTFLIFTKIRIVALGCTINLLTHNMEIVVMERNNFSHFFSTTSDRNFKYQFYLDNAASLFPSSCINMSYVPIIMKVVSVIDCQFRDI